jgi:hypothetical protein
VAAAIRTALRVGRRVLPSPTGTPFTFWYLVVLAGTTALIRLVTPTMAHRLLAASSTDAVNLAHRPVAVLVLSALWLVDGHWLAYAAIFSVVLAPLERRIGARWTALVFASGHVLATLVTEVPVLWATRAHLLPHDDAHLLDVGVSYGFYASAGALLLLLRGPARWWLLGLLNVSILLIYLDMGLTDADSVVTALGHGTALYIGMIGWQPMLRRRGLIGSVALPTLRGVKPKTMIAPPPVAY